MIFFILIIIIILVTTSIFLPKIKGVLGETVVAKLLLGLPEDKYIILNNIMLKTEKGTTQIDHIVVSIYGIFVIETKNYKGIITGTEFGDKWTKNMYGKKYYFYNPLKQNYGHVKALEKLLGIEEIMFIPIVVFSVSSQINVKVSKPIIYTSQLKKTILSYSHTKYTELQIKQIAGRILSANVDSKENRRNHVDMIRTTVNTEKASIANNICPKCGGKLVDRKGKYGAFKGCSNFPKCRYILNK